MAHHKKRMLGLIKISVMRILTFLLPKHHIQTKQYITFDPVALALKKKKETKVLIVRDT